HLAALGRGLKPQTLRSLLEACAEDVRGRLAALGEAAERRDLGRLRMEAHALRGNAANYGLVALAAAAAAVERAAAEGDATAAVDGVDRVRDAASAALSSLAETVPAPGK
ncbi:MAG: Hpt domain-containing protein, partial [Elioraea sp.]|nr:Hpt domain-containing protein [Elioraea sp.]